MVSKFLLLSLLASPAAAISAGGAKKMQASSFLHDLQFKQVLRVCNAYPYEEGLDVFIGKEKLTSTPLGYKDCDDYSPPLSAGDKVDFKVDGSTAGTFTISELPAGDAVLMMVIYRHDSLSSAVAFESHVFANVPSAQIAVIDTYKGKGKDHTEIRVKDVPHKKDDKHPTPPAARMEMLRFNSVVAVSSGQYEVELFDTETHNPKTKSELVALPKTSYCVIRVGVEAEEGKQYPPEIMVFPHSDKLALGSSAAPLSAGVALFLAAAMSLFGAF